MPVILIVEDDTFLSSTYRLKFTKVGFTVYIAMDGQEAINILQNVRPDVILLDLVMPVKDGFTVLSEVKANDQYKTIPVIVTSNLSQKEDIDKAKGLGAADFIIKSDVSLDDLVKKVQNLLAGKPG
ncbi:MAG: Response regulator receiver domain protein [Microgenomates group bacterium GW2011_GWC1_43_11]|nr:MAG: Response regulator receiver domain protein [Microgenomates group bacterium GW2011_GWC1_43_11]